MAERPVTILPPTLERVLAGSCTRIRRPATSSALASLRPGDHLWLREQFYLTRSFDFTPPLVALSRGAVPVYARDREVLPPYATADLGRRRFARELPKDWHRFHLEIHAIRRERLHEIPDEDIAAEGHESRERFASAWDAGVSLSGWRDKWKADPEVLVITFRAFAHPLPSFARALIKEGIAS